MERNLKHLIEFTDSILGVDDLGFVGKLVELRLHIRVNGSERIHLWQVLSFNDGD